MMKALTVHQPYADMIALRYKRVENRRWCTAHRGWLAIHAGLSTAWYDRRDSEHRDVYDRSRHGVVVAIVCLTDCVHLRDIETYARSTQRWYLLTHKHVEGLWCWILDVHHRVRRRIEVRGGRSLWEIPPDVDKALGDDLADKHKQRMGLVTDN